MVKREGIRRRIRVWLPGLVGSLAILLAACGASDRLADRIDGSDAWTQPISPSTEERILSNGRFDLFLEPDMSVRLEDRRNRTVWSTNGLPVTDAPVTKDQFVLTYYNRSGTAQRMGSWADSVERDQAQAFIRDGSLLVRYHLGNRAKTAEDVPGSLSDARFRGRLLDRLDAEAQSELLGYYKFYQKDGRWRINFKGTNNFERILVLMLEAGYQEQDLTMDNQEAGIVVDAAPKAFFTVVLEYALTDGGLSVSIPTEFMEFSSDYPPFEISLLQDFGLAEQGKEGYVFLPDGCGALMRFSDGLDDRSELALPVYGRDLTLTSEVLTNNRTDFQEVLLPVFGMKDGDASFLAVLDGAESKATLHAGQAGVHSPRNTAYASFRLIDKDTVFLSGNDEHGANVLVFENRLFEGACRVEYLFLDKGSGYVDMAKAYRDRLVEEGMLSRLPSSEDGSAPLLMETLNGVKGYRNLLGISYTGVIRLTGYEETRDLMEDLRKSGITRLDWKMTGWFNDGYRHDDIGTLRLQAELGGRRQWDDLADYARRNGIGLYPDVEFQSFPRGSLRFIPLLHAARSLDFSEVTTPVLSLARQAENDGSGLEPSRLYVLSPARLQKETERFMASFVSLGAGGISLRSSGNTLFSDFNAGRTIDRTETLGIMTRHLEAVRKSAGSVLIHQAAAYALPYASAVSEVPLESSHFALAFEEVPFYQIVTHGSTTLYGKAMNLTANASHSLLRSIEYGTYLNYQITACESSLLKDTEMTTNFSSCYADWKASILRSYKASNDALSGLGNAFITDHRQVSDAVFVTEYDGRTNVYVNYNDEDVAVDGGVVPAAGFLVVR